VPVRLAGASAARRAAGGSRADGGFDSIESVRRLFASDLALVAGWVHYLAFDLLVGVHVDERAERAGIGRLALLPAFLLTFLFGPLGWLLYRVQEWATPRLRAARPEVPDVPVDRGPIALAHGALRHADGRLLAIAGGVLALVPPTVLAALIDDRTLDGANLWIKPLKFELSLAVYAATLAVVVPLAGARAGATRGCRWLVRILASGVVVEMAWILFQAARGTRSHFNVATPFEGAMYGVMGIFAVAIVVAPVVLLPTAWRERRGALRAGIVAGLALNLLLGGVFGAILSARSSHFIGGDVTGATGLPFLGWSTTGGDLRIAHFVGLHALQAMIVAGAIASTWQRRAAAIAVWMFAAAWSVLAVALAVLALRGIAPPGVGLAPNAPDAPRSALVDRASGDGP
jgi:hypothetical protein